MHISICIGVAETSYKFPPQHENRSSVNLGSENPYHSLNNAPQAYIENSTYVDTSEKKAFSPVPLGKFDQASSNSTKDLQERVTLRSRVDSETKNEENDVMEKTMKEGGIEGVSDSIDIESIDVEDDYSGPKFDERRISLKFMQEVLKHFEEKKKLHQKYVYKILRKLRNYYRRQPALIDIKLPKGQTITICGDIHGQMYDLLNIFKINGIPSETNRYLFNGDFVDRGRYSVECVIILFGFKLLYPNRVFLNRGNHESKMMNHYFGFAKECRFKYSQKMLNVFSEVFQWLPVAHCINSQVLVLHAGLFHKDGVTLADIKHIERQCEPVDNQLMFDMLWSDPKENDGRSPNFMRGAGIKFGPDVTRAFCVRNKLNYIVRSHYPAKDGYVSDHNGRLITVFSAPNYYGGNKGAIMKLCAPKLDPSFITFTQTPDPSWDVNVIKEEVKEKNQTLHPVSTLYR